MSGLKNEPRTGGGAFVNFKDGKLINVDDSGTKQEYTSLDGLIIDMDVRDEMYKGVEYKKITLFIKDDEGKVWKLGFPLESGYGDAFLSIAPNIDFTKEVSISGGVKPMPNDRTYGTVYIKQDGQNLKWALKKEDKPQGVKTRMGIDYSEKYDFFYKMIIEEIRPAIVKVSGVDNDVKKGKAQKAKA